MEAKYKYSLSIIIVNYNVEYFLDQCLDSVRKATQNISAEVIVIDNASIDGSTKLMREKYSDLHLIFNEENLGFSKANNQGINISQGEYVLLLNPDTVVAKDSFIKVVDFMNDHPQAGGLGVHMIDGKGRFLPESKRGLPTPAVAFYKIFGLSSIFSKSKRFGQYHAGHLDEFEINEIDILSGAFMLMRKSALDKVGLLDEEFFMYGEDIDLSYRIQKGGYKNYYYPETSIIHYKGESTKKSSVNYVFVFYRAMIIFAKKHFKGKNAWLFSFLINMAIYFRAFIAISGRAIKRFFLPFLDLLAIIFGLFGLTNYWSMASIEFPEELIMYSIPIYALTWVTVVFFNGGYDQPLKLFKYIKGTLYGTIPILVAYAILPKSLQFSRLFIFMGALWVLSYYLISRIYLHFGIGGKFRLADKRKRDFAVIGSKNELARIKDLLSQTQDKLGNIENYQKIEDFIKSSSSVDEIILCSEELEYKEIISLMKSSEAGKLEFKTAPNSRNHLIGSNSIDTAGDLYIMNINALVSLENKLKTRLFDMGFSSLFLLLSPIVVFFFKDKKNFLLNMSRVFIGKKSFIGFSNELSMKDVRLPRIKQGILTPDSGIEIELDGVKEKLNLLYARDYSMRKDFSIVFKSWQKLDD